MHLDRNSKNGSFICTGQEQQSEHKSVYFYLWVASLFVSTIYTIAWDIKMDWGFLDSNAGDNKFLREEIVYPNKVSTQHH